jgi:hypothetical protein
MILSTAPNKRARRFLRAGSASFKPVMGRLSHVLGFIVLAIASPSWAIPPLVSGDVPTADKGTFEWYLGTRFQSEDGEHNVQLPTTELVYGITTRQEIMVEIQYLSEDGEQGLGDLVIGTKFVFVKESEKVPGIAGSFELKIPTASESRGLGSGEFDYDLRLRAQKTWGRFTAIGNVGYTFITDPEFDGAPKHRDDVWFVSCAQQYEIGEKTSLLSEIYWESAEEPGEPDRVAANVGFKRKLAPNLTGLGAIGKSLREGNEGGPGLRVFVGLKIDFESPWAKHHRKAAEGR